MGVSKLTDLKINKKTTHQLVKDWESAKKRVNKELNKEKDKDKKKRLELFSAYLENNFVDERNGIITSKFEKRDLTNICGSKEFGERRWKS